MLYRGYLRSQTKYCRMKEYRHGAVGALLDEYERAIRELQAVIADLSAVELTAVVDTDTADANCRSIQTILSHVVSAGYAYAVDIQRLRGEDLGYADLVLYPDAESYRQELSRLFDYTADTFRDIRDDELEQYDHSKKIQTAWGQVYDIEQLTEHAIVHILRHRRQIERFKLWLRQTI